MFIKLVNYLDKYLKVIKAEVLMVTEFNKIFLG